MSTMQSIAKSRKDRSFVTYPTLQSDSLNLSSSFRYDNSNHFDDQSLSSERQSDRKFIDSSPAEVCCFTFLLLPNYSAGDLASAINVLNLANQISGRTLYRWQVASNNGYRQVSSERLEVCVDHSIDSLELSSNSRLVLCGGGPQTKPDQQFCHWLNRAAVRGVKIGSLNTGCYMLAYAGLLDGYRCTSHWEFLQSMSESFPLVDISSQLFVVDRDRFSCSGGSGVIDLMVHFVSVDCSRKLAETVSEALVCERIRGPEEAQRVPLRFRLGSGQPRLMEATALMESNLEEPLLLKDLAGYVGVSTRQLERLFSKHLGCTPARYYLELRLVQAHKLLSQTNYRVTDVALACGFLWVSHFSKCYREFYGVSPREVRLNFSTNNTSE